MAGKYKVITLCGSTRFKEAFLEVQKQLTLKGNIVISVGLFGHSGDEEVWTPGTKEMLDDMHRAKIDLADEIFVVNVGGYIGSSTLAEIEYAESKGKPVKYLTDSVFSVGKPKKMDIEDYPFETFFYEWFHNCRMLEFVSKNDERRRFVEYVDRTDVSSNIADVEHFEDLSVKNAVRQLLDENAVDYFYEKGEQGTFLVVLAGEPYYVKVKDITKQWPNHYWLRAKRPIVGFKAVSHNGGSVMQDPMDPSVCYEVGKEYTFDENAMINDRQFGPFFSLSFRKAYSYLKKGYRMYLVSAAGLLFVKNRWDDMAASKMRIVRELTGEDMKRIDLETNDPKGFWTGDCWDSLDDDFAWELRE